MSCGIVVIKWGYCDRHGGYMQYARKACSVSGDMISGISYTELDAFLAHYLDRDGM
jgi:hypothetical protein